MDSNMSHRGRSVWLLGGAPSSIACPATAVDARRSDACAACADELTSSFATFPKCSTGSTPRAGKGSGGILDIGNDGEQQVDKTINKAMYIVGLVFCLAVALCVMDEVYPSSEQVVPAKGDHEMHNYVLEQQDNMLKTTGQVDLSCLSPGFMHKAGTLKVGEKLRVVCPKGCREHKWIERHMPLIWGSDNLYSDNSMVCLAALHRYAPA